jgi:hypothetical protein
MSFLNDDNRFFSVPLLFAAWTGRKRVFIHRKKNVQASSSIIIRATQIKRSNHENPAQCGFDV